ncbi:TlpA family protein disulfide reductase [Agromyces sp. ZXT2-6]|uniref:TlpA family protein disulfide reductase n=1 Tax=Agromyces sp. ZXT2-6 TaxID=3461153 RepID=UPI004054F395
MDLVPAFVAGIGLPLVATAIGVLARSREGRVRTNRATPSLAPTDGDASDAAALGLARDALGADVTLVQFSTSYCSRCPGVARSLAGLAEGHDGDVRHIEVDLTDDAALADRFDVRQTPTVLVLDATGRTVGRIAGVPRVGELRTLIDDLTRRYRVPQHA